MPYVMHRCIQRLAHNQASVKNLLKKEHTILYRHRGTFACSEAHNFILLLVFWGARWGRGEPVAGTCTRLLLSRLQQHLRLRGRPGGLLREAPVCIRVRGVLRCLLWEPRYTRWRLLVPYVPKSKKMPDPQQICGNINWLILSLNRSCPRPLPLTVTPSLFTHRLPLQ